MFERLGRLLARPFRGVSALAAAPTGARTTITPYEAAGLGRRAIRWQSPALGANDAMLGSVETLRQRARQGVRNDGYAKTAIDRLVSNIIGTGMAPESKAPDPAFRKQVHQLWLDWTDESDADGVLDFYGQQAMAVRAWLEAGECFIRMRNRLPSDGLSVPMQLQVIEAEHCPTSFQVLTPNRRIRAGIEIDPIGRRAAYWLYPARPAEGKDVDMGSLVRVPADTVVHLYDPLRPGQLRGLPSLTQALIRLYEIDQYDDATIVRQKVAAMFAGFLERTPSAADIDLNPMTGQASDYDDEDNEIVSLEPGLMQELRPGEKANFSNPPDASGYGEFMRMALMSASVAADVPYEVLTGDLRAINDRTVRIVLNEFRRRIEQRQHFIVAYQMNRVVWEAWFTRAVTSGRLTVPAAYQNDQVPWRRVEWVAASWPYLNPVQDIDAHKKAIRAGVKTLTETIKEISGRSLEEVMAERKAELTLLDSLGIVTDSDPRKTTDTGQDPNPAPAAPRPPGVTNIHVEAPPPPPPPETNVNAPIYVDSRPTGRRRVVKNVVRDPITHRITQVVEDLDDATERS